MSYEVEVKYRAGGRDDLPARLADLGAEPADAASQEDAYLGHPCRDFAQTNEALRLRRVGESNRVTYKGPRHAGPTKTREEIELPLGEGDGNHDQWSRLFEALGFRPVAAVRKVRRPYRLTFQGRLIEVAIDDAEGIGEFVEVEAIAETEADLPDAQGAVLELARILGLSEVEPRSYLRMALELIAADCVTPGLASENPSGQKDGDLVITPPTTVRTPPQVHVWWEFPGLGVCAMDRRRFVPSSEGLEGRALLSLFGHTKSAQTVNVDDLPLTFAEKEARIQRLPYYLDQLQTGRFLAPDVISDLQSELTTVAGKIPHSPPSAALNDFNHNLRAVLPQTSLSVKDAQILNRDFSSVLNKTGIAPDILAALKADMNQIARVDSQSRQPIYLSTNDYTLVLQDTLAIGRPIARPGIPDLALHNGVRVKQGVNVTNIHHPTLVGTYQPPGSTILASPVGTTIELLNADGALLGTAAVPRSGKYVLTVSEPLPLGTNVLRVRAVDQQGLESNPSSVFLIRVIPKKTPKVVTGMATPQGPAGTI